MTDTQLRDALHEIEAVIGQRIDGGPAGRPSASQALYLIDHIARGALYADAGVDLMPRATMGGEADGPVGGTLKRSA
ncbi:MAG: hypothetical protein GEU80_16675 [Dehalococcoidia bacterium]|nr:hypothetical protein [Dehalococcoidia bacterium]